AHAPATTLPKPPPPSGMWTSGTRPPMGVKESCIEFTQPHDASVVIVAYSAEFAIPKRTSLPSMLPPGLVADAMTSTPRAAWIGLPRASAQFGVVPPPMNSMYIAAHNAQPFF